MSDEFGTVNVRRGDRAREIEVMRQHYRRHRETLQRMVADAPTEHLAAEYQRLVADIDVSMTKLDELEVGSATIPTATMAATLGAGAGAGSVPHPAASPLARPLDNEKYQDYEATQPQYNVPEDPYATSDRTPGRGSRVLVILAAGAIVLALIAWLIWRGSRDERPGLVDEQATATAPITETETQTETTASEPQREPERAPSESGLTVRPAQADYGTIGKGTRASRQVEVTNDGDDPVTIAVARSQCRCLYYEYEALIPPKAKETITVTVDGAKAKAGVLRESIPITVKGDPSNHSQFVVSATIR